MSILLTIAIAGLFIGLIAVIAMGEKRPSASEQRTRAIKAARAAQREQGIAPKAERKTEYQLEGAESMWNF